MCGIIGFLTNQGFQDYTKRKSWFQTALMVDMVRGWDSTGIFGVDHFGDNDYRKGAMLPYEFLDMRSVQGLLSKHNWRCLVGHNRAATSGKTTGANAHPFEQGKILGVHNGTLEWNWRKELPGADDFNVDSQAIFNAFDISPYEEVLEKIDGAFTLVWHDNEDKVVRIVRNDQRPLFLCKVKDEETIFFASEDWIALGPARRLGYEFEEIFQPDPGKLYEFPINDIMNFDEKKVELYKPKEVVKYQDKKKRNVKKSYKELGINSKTKYDFVVSSWMPYKKDDKRGYLKGVSPFLTDEYGVALECVVHNVDIDGFLQECGTDTLKKVTIKGKPMGLTYPKGHKNSDPFILLNYKEIEIEDNNLQDWPENLKGPDGKEIPRLEWMDLTDDGCCMCGDMLIPADHEKVKWFNGNPVCPNKSCQSEAAHHFGADK